MRHQCPAPRRAAGFTIIELLIVVGIISVLLTLLLTMTGRIRDRAHMIMCQSNMRQLYVATVAYASNNDGYLIAPSLIGEGPTGTGKNVCWAMNQPAVANLTVGTIRPYMPQSVDERGRAMLCPSDINESSRGGGATGSETRNFSYSFNIGIRPLGSGSTATLKLSEIAQPVKRVMIYEEFGPNDGACFGPGDSDDWLSGRHGGENSTLSQTRGIYSDAKWREIGQGNVCYFDGRVELMTVAHYFYDTSHYSPLKQ